jgi:hypothetical protein
MKIAVDMNTPAAKMARLFALQQKALDRRKPATSRRKILNRI